MMFNHFIKGYFLVEGEKCNPQRAQSIAEGARIETKQTELVFSSEDKSVCLLIDHPHPLNLTL